MRHGVVIHHPSRAPEARAALARFALRLERERPGYRLWCLGSPPGPVLDRAAELPAGADFHIVPLLVLPGRHVLEDVAELATALCRLRPDLQVKVRPPLIEDEALSRALLGLL